MKNFHLKPDEELFSIIDRIKRTEDENITLVVPRGMSALRSVINLRILKEEAISLGKDISIITFDSLIRKLAQQVNLTVLEKIEKEREERWPEQLQEKIVKPRKRVMSDIVVSPKEEEIIEEEPEEEDEEEIIEEEKEEIEEEAPTELGVPTEIGKEPVFAKRKEPKEAFRFFTKKRSIISGVVLCLIILGFILYFSLPKAEVVINPKKETIRFEAEITADKNVDSVNFTDASIPGQVFQLEMEDSRKFPTTGEKDVEEKAQGTILVYNQYSSSDQTLVETTRFLSEGGKLFRLIETTIIPGATIEEGKIIPSSKEVKIAADEPGEAYNIGPSHFTIPGFKGSPKYEAFYGQSTESMTGGAKGKMRVATKDDIEGATEIVSLELKDKIGEQFAKKIPNNLKLLKESQILEITQADSSLKIDEPGKEFLISIKAKAWGLAFREEDLFYLIEKSIGDKISENKFLVPATIKVDYTDTQLDITQGKAVFSCRVEAQAAWKLNEDEIKNNLAGRNEIEVRKYLSSLSEIETAKVVFWPFWVKKIPKNKDKIRISIEPE